MNDQMTDEPSLTRRVTDAALIVIAFAALTSWIWRRLRKGTSVESAAASGDTIASTLDDKVGAATGVPSEGAS